MGLTSWVESVRPRLDYPPETQGSQSTESVIHDGDVAYVHVAGGNGATGYQDAGGAPVERQSPLGYHVNWVAIIFLNVNMMVGTGIFSAPGYILGVTGSIGLSLIYWTIGFILAVAGLGVYLEFVSYFPSRSGAEVVWLEQAYPQPRYFFPVAYAVLSVILSFNSSNAVVLSQYFWAMVGKEPTAWELKGVAVASFTIAVLCVLFHNKASFWLSNAIGICKLILLVFISIAGFVILGGHNSRIHNPGINFRNGFSGTTNNGNDLAVAMVNISFAYAGWWNSCNLANEIKNPVPTLKKNSALSLSVVFILYLLCNIAYFSCVQKEEFAVSRETAASIFFNTAFGNSAAKALNFCVMLSAFGNLLVVIIGQARQIREIGRQGVLPYTDFWVSTKTFGTPLGPYALKYALTILMILAPPAGDAFAFTVSLQTYPTAMFHLALAIGLFMLRNRRKRANTPPSNFKAWYAAVILYLLLQVYLLVMPWFPPKGGPYAGDVSFWYATYCVAGIGIMATCGIYYIGWMHIFPRWKEYAIRSEVVNVDDRGATTHRLVRVPYGDLDEWDRKHDEQGRVRDGSMEELELNGSQLEEKGALQGGNPLEPR